jgi:hypothetical protein
LVLASKHAGALCHAAAKRGSIYAQSHTAAVHAAALVGTSYLVCCPHKLHCLLQASDGTTTFAQQLPRALQQAVNDYIDLEKAPEAYHVIVWAQHQQLEQLHGENVQLRDENVQLRQEVVALQASRAAV